MAILLHWITAGAPSCFYTAAALARGEALADRSLASALRAPAATFLEEAVARRLDPELLLEHLVPLSPPSTATRIWRAPRWKNSTRPADISRRRRLLWPLRSARCGGLFSPQSHKRPRNYRSVRDRCVSSGKRAARE
jgi:hypothetical protein